MQKLSLANSNDILLIDCSLLFFQRLLRSLVRDFMNPSPNLSARCPKRLSKVETCSINIHDQ